MARSNDLVRLAWAVRASTLKRLRAVPPGRENWCPGAGALSFADLAGHLADADRWLFRKIEEPDLPPIAALAGAVTVADRTDFDRLLNDLERLGERRAAILATLGPEQLAETMPDARFGGEVTVWWIVVRGNLDHEAHHRGQLALMLRLAGGG